MPVGVTSEQSNSPDDVVMPHHGGGWASPSHHPHVGQSGNGAPVVT
jgi:hypothetical protein